MMARIGDNTSPARADANPSQILSMTGVSMQGDRAHGSTLWNVSLTLGRGELALVKLEAEQVSLPLSDLAQGLMAPTSGNVRFLGLPWSGMTPALAARQRGCTGRVFEGWGWFSQLSVRDNILLAQRHHTRRPEAQIIDEASRLCRYFGLPGLPQSKPFEMRRDDLQRAACARAFMGRPALLLLERPTHGIYPDVMAPLVNAVRGVRLRGAAVIWCTSNPLVWNDRGIASTGRYIMSGAQMLEAPQLEQFPGGQR